jgi:hypothetical protein
MMNLLLNFESFDQTTEYKDVYMPEEKVINFNVGFLKLNFLGKLRLTQDRETNKKGNKIKVVDSDGPSTTYGVIEDRDLYIKFDKPVVVKYLYIRPHSEPKDKIQTIDANIFGYLNEEIQFTQRHHLTYSKKWSRINLNLKVIDALRLPEGFDVDDINISHDSEYGGDLSEHQGQLTNIIQTVIDELIEENTKGKRIKEEDI